MKRDPDYLREILFKVEESETDILAIRRTLGMSSKQRKKVHHIELLCDAGLLVQVSDSGYRLTFQGHDFLDSIRDETRWKKIIERIKTTGGDWTLDILKKLGD